MTIVILGNGGAISDGLAYNSFIIDGHVLVETPPDIMNSLFREATDLAEIDIIYISHFHGDHCFGLPFLLLRMFFDAAQQHTTRKLTVIGPDGIAEKTKELCALAVGKEHPLHRWIEASVSFTPVADGTITDIGGYELRSFPMHHFATTFGFTISRGGAALLSYFADTVWNEALVNELRKNPKAVIADMNGEPADPVKVHLSEADVIAHAVPECSDKTMFYGTHLKHQKSSSHGRIIYVRPGDRITI